MRKPYKDRDWSKICPQWKPREIAWEEWDYYFKKELYVDDDKTRFYIFRRKGDSMPVFILPKCKDDQEGRMEFFRLLSMEMLSRELGRGVTESKVINKCAPYIGRKQVEQFIEIWNATIKGDKTVYWG